MSTSYTQLVSDIQTEAENTGTDFVAQIPNFISRSQFRIHRDMDSYGIVTYVTVSADPGSYIIAKPSAALVVKHLYLVSAGRREPLILRTDEFINEYWPDRTSAGTPKYYANWGFTNWLIAPAVSVSSTFEASIIQRPVELSAAVSTNWITDYAPEVLFYACMKEACLFMKNYGGADVWEAEYQKAMANLRNEARRTRQDDQSNNNSPAGGDNTYTPNGV